MSYANKKHSLIFDYFKNIQLDKSQFILVILPQKLWSLFPSEIKE